jgi:flagellar biosynthetic protein FliR
VTGELAALFAAAPEYFGQFLLVFLRIGTAMFVLPVFGEAMLPLRIRLGIAIAFSFIAFPSVLPSLQIVELAAPGYLIRGFAEVLTGLVIGLMLRFHIMAIQIAAAIAAQSTSLSQLLGNNSIDPQPALGLILYMAALALAVELGLHVQLAIMFIASYEAIGPGELIGTGAAAALRDAAGVAFRFGFILAAPFVAVSLLYNLALGVINRAMPQLMVAFVGAPAITLGAMIVLALTAPLMLTVWSEALERLLANPFGAR